MKIKQIEVRSQQSYNFNSYEVSLVVELDSAESYLIVAKQLQSECRALVEEQIQIDKDKLGGKNGKN